jgi:hypothetical protein
MAFAPTDDEEVQPALKPAVAQGALTGGGSPVATKPSWLDVLGQTLQDMAPGIAQDPAHAQVLAQVAQASRKAQVDQGTWSHITLPNGQVARINSKQGIPQVMNPQTGGWEVAAGKYPAEDKDKWGVITPADTANGIPAVMGYRPDKETWDAQQAAAKANPPAPPSKFLGDETKDGPEYAKSLNPADLNIINGWHAGTGIIPSQRDADKDPKTMKMIASAQKLYPDTDFTNLPARSRLAKTLTDAAPGSNGGIIANSNTAIGILNDAADQHLALHNSGDFMGSSNLGNAGNYASNKMADSKRAAVLTHLAANGDDASGEITKVLTGGPGGVEERKARSARIANPNYVPSEAAGALEGELNDLASKHKQTVDKVREQMGQSYLDKNPVVEQNFKDQETLLRGKIEQLRAGGSATKPTAGSFNNVPWSIK